MQILVNLAVVVGFIAIMTGSFLARRALGHQTAFTD
jgi:hypothetical protein